MKEYDVIIVGGGPGGLTAGMYSARAELNTICLEKLMPGGQIANTELVEDYPGFESIAGHELAKKFENHAIKFGLNIEYDNVQKIKLDGRYRIIEADNDTYKAKAIIVGTGGQPRLLGVPGEKEYTGKGVSYCAICDGAFFKDRVIAVAGGGDAAVEEGIFLTKFGSKVYIIHRRDQLRAQKVIQKRAFDNPKIEFIWDSVVEKVNGSDTIESIDIKNVKTGGIKNLPVGALFPFIGFTPNSDIFDFEVTKDEGGYIITNEYNQTNVEGIYAIGDVRKQLCKQITNAVGDGTTAAVAADKYIEAWND
ncbi:MAG: thioredoxin-disulfide reductase [candidate division Zixibacteria bacterium]|nr:thioredoxin-disulfide reductase [candidate division Zixibacteria bacterium]